MYDINDSGEGGDGGEGGEMEGNAEHQWSQYKTESISFSSRYVHLSKFI